MRVSAACEDLHTQSQNGFSCPAAEGRDRAAVSPAELGLHCSSRAAGKNRHKVLPKTARLMDVK